MGEATRQIKVGTWIASIHMRHSYACAKAAELIADATGERMILGLGMSHRPVNAVLGAEMPSPGAGGKVPIELLGLLAGKDVLLGAIDVANERIEKPEEVAATIERALAFVPPERLFPCTNCGMAPMGRPLAIGKLAALTAGAALVRGRIADKSR
jgi:Cobalamin-independent synthase, Catalytic domain